MCCYFDTEATQTNDRKANESRTHDVHLESQGNHNELKGNQDFRKKWRLSLAKPNWPDLSVLFLESNVFSKNLSQLAEFVTAAKTAGKNVNNVP